VIVDQYGHPIKPALLKTEVAAPQPMGVRSIASAAPSANIDPLRLARILKAAEEGDTAAYFELASEMEEKYLHYAAQLATRKRAVSGILGEIVPASEEARDVAAAELVEQCLPVIQGALFDMLDSIGKGFSLTEIMWDFSERQWMPVELRYRDPRWFRFDKVDGRTLRMADDSNPDGVYLPPGKFIIHYSAARTGLPIKNGMARAASWAYMFHNFSLRDWVTFIEFFGKPLRLGRYDSGTVKPSDLDILMAAVQAIGTDGAAILPKSVEIEFPEVAQARGENGLWLSLLEYLDREVSKLVLGQTLTADTGKGGGGSYALGNVHNDVRMDILADDARSIAATINRDLIPLIVGLNLSGIEKYPVFRLPIEEPEDLVAMKEIVKDAVALGFPVSQQWFSEKFGIPMAEEGKPTLGIVGAIPAGETGDDGAAAGKSGASGGAKYDAGLINAYSMGIDRFARLGMSVPESFVRDVFGIPAPKGGEKLLEPTSNDGIADVESSAHGRNMPEDLPSNEERLTADTAPVIAGWIGTIEAMLESADSLEAFQEMLLKAYPKLDTRAMAMPLSMARLALNLAGRSDAADGV
jgi:phage gp29-like protein